MRSLLLLVLLVGCGSKETLPLPPIPPHPQVTRCKPGVAQEPAPPLPRTTNTIIVAYNKAKAAGLATEAALRECSAKVDMLLGKE